MSYLPLTFAALDGLAFAAQRSRLKELRPDTAYGATALGPFLELRQLGADGLLPHPDNATWLALDGLSALETALRRGQPQWICPASQTAGFLRTGASWSDDDNAWIGFGIAAQTAATAVGFPRRIARQFVGALGEMINNIHEHSGAAMSGIAAFRAANGEFEFVVVDHGMGVLKSLRTCPDYAHLSDHGEALRLALTDGVSRFGPQAKRGLGFRPIFVGLANLSGSLRFRSGDHAVVIDGQKIDTMAIKTAQKPYLHGFFASVTCRSRFIRGRGTSGNANGRPRCAGVNLDVL
jgi:hypothetical protein